jgi:hypothetical protein
LFKITKPFFQKSERVARFSFDFVFSLPYFGFSQQIVGQNNRETDDFAFIFKDIDERPFDKKPVCLDARAEQETDARRFARRERYRQAFFYSIQSGFIALSGAPQQKRHKRFSVLLIAVERLAGRFAHFGLNEISPALGSADSAIDTTGYSDKRDASRVR